MHDYEESSIKTKADGKAQRDTDLLLKMLKWLRDAEMSTPESEYRTVSAEDYRFYAGRQDTAEVIDKLSRERRPTSVYNEVKPKIDMLIGNAAQAKYSPRLQPVGKEDEPLAELANGVYTHYRKKLNLQRRELECFEHTVKSGRSMLYFHIDKKNPFKPQIKSKRLPGGTFLLDPDSVEYDLSDAKYVFIDKWLRADAIKTFWPEFDAEARGDTAKTSDMPFFWNEAKELYRIVECWYRGYAKVRWFINPLTQEPESLYPAEFNKFVLALQEGVPVEGQDEPFVLKGPLENIPSWREEIHYCLFTGDLIFESRKSPYNWEGFPCVLYGAYKDDDYNNWFGAVTMMKDPQRAVNTTRRQLTHLLQTLPKGLLMHEIGAILDVEEYETRSSEPNYHMEMQKGALDKAKFVHQPQISSIYQSLDATMSQAMNDASGIEKDLMGVQGGSREPGISVRTRRESGFTVLYILFNNFSESRKLGGKILFSLIQQYSTEKEVVRIEGQKGVELLEINSQMNPQVKGFNDISAMKFDLEVDEAVETATLRQIVSQILTDFSHNNPNVVPPDVIMEYADVPFTVKNRVQLLWEQQREQEQANLEADREIELMKIEAELKVAKIRADSGAKSKKEGDK